jgi:A/G-specific adenine glycosylase
MLQQTQVGRVEARWPEFVNQWPTPSALASEPLSELLGWWQGLGYPRRARNLHRAAGQCVARHGGQVPVDLDRLLALPGVGPYTARAVMSFAAEVDVGVVDTNVGRILARWAGEPLSPSEAQGMADALVPQGQSWAWNQAMFDLGALRCRPRAPQCSSCPAATWCAWGADADNADPATGSAGVSTKQAAFAGSNRQLRGFVMRAAAEHKHLDDLAGLHPTVDVGRWDDVVASLVADGLIVVDSAVLRLAG